MNEKSEGRNGPGFNAVVPVLSYLEAACARAAVRCAAGNEAAARHSNARVCVRVKLVRQNQDVWGWVKAKGVVVLPVDRGHVEGERHQCGLIQQRLDHVRGDLRLALPNVGRQNAVSPHLVHNVLAEKNEFLGAVPNPRGVGGERCPLHPRLKPLGALLGQPPPRKNLRGTGVFGSRHKDEVGVLAELRVLAWQRRSGGTGAMLVTSTAIPAK